jgi:hypothetical protein
MIHFYEGAVQTKRIAKRILAAFCAAVLTLGILTFSTAAASDVCFLSLNDTVSPLTADLMPIKLTSIVYIPYTVFDRNITGINLGVFYGQDKAMGTVTLYSKDKTLIFDVSAGYAYDYPEGNNYPYRAIIRNGRVYLPAYSVCQFFGLTYSYLSTDYGPLVRIKEAEEWWLNDVVFISSAASLMSSRLNEYLQSQASESPAASPSVTVPATTGPSDGDKSNVRVYLALRVDSGQQTGELLDILSAQSVPVLFFFRPSELMGYDDLIRRMVGSGHQIGLLVKGETTQALEEQLAEGNRLLEHIVRQRTYTVLVDGTDAQRTALSENGWLCWLENVDGQNYGRSSSTLVSNIMWEVGAKRSFARILMDDSGNIPSALSKLIHELKTAQYDIRLAVETTF